MSESVASASAEGQIVVESVESVVPAGEAGSHLYLYLIALAVVLAVVYLARGKSRPSKK